MPNGRVRVNVFADRTPTLDSLLLQMEFNKELSKTIRIITDE
jgi:hypothetical protein